jgi:hypothetical protein
MIEVSFDSQGHLTISPDEFLRFAIENPDRLVDDVLCHGTPAIFTTYGDYRAFIDDVATSLRVSPFSIWVRGSAQLGFSMSPRASKVWVAAGQESDIDLAIVDPDHYHLFDVEIRRWERSNVKERARLQNLRNGRRFYCYRHYDLPTVQVCDTYKNAIADVRQRCGRDITAFFYRDTWALHDRYIKDVRDLLSQNAVGLPKPRHSPRERVWLRDEDLLSCFLSTNDLELNLACDRSEEANITDRGLQGLNGLGRTQWLWLDNAAVGDAGVGCLGESRELRFLSLAGTRVTDACLKSIAQQFPCLECLVLDNTSVTQSGARAFCQNAGLLKLSGYRNKWFLKSGGPVKNRNGAIVEFLT